MIKRSSMILALLSSTLLTLPSAASSEALCLEAVEEKLYARLTTVCVDLPHRNRLEKLRLLASGNFTHYLGTVSKPSKAFSLLKENADKNDANAQYMYSQLYRTVHSATAESWSTHPENQDSISLKSFNSQVQAESEKWLSRAADNGHTLALLEVAEDMLLSSYTSEDVNLRQALRIARSAETKNPTLANSLISRLKKRIKEY